MVGVQVSKTYKSIPFNKDNLNTINITSYNNTFIILIADQSENDESNINFDLEICSFADDRTPNCLNSLYFNT